MRISHWGRLIQQPCASPCVYIFDRWTQRVCQADALHKYLDHVWKSSGDEHMVKASPPLARRLGPQHRMPVLHGPSSVDTCLNDPEARGCGETIVGAWANVGGWPSHSASWMYTSIRTKKKRGKREVVHKNTEQLETKAS